MKTYTLISSLMVLTGTLITLSSTSWISAWLGMELNLLGFIPMMSSQNPLSKETTMKYFIIQAMSSSIFIMFSSTINLPIYSNHMLTNTLTSAALLMKIAMAPLHSWLIQIISHINWPQILILLTWQKLAPLSILMKMTNPLLNTFVVTSALIGPTMMMNQTSLKKIITYSSIAHLAWIMSPNLNSMSYMYFTFYSLSSISIILSLHITKSQSTFHLTSLPLSIKNPLIFNLLSLGGFPPLINFFPKLIILKHILYSNTSPMLPLILVLSSLMTLYVYLSITFNSMMNKTTFYKASYMTQFNSLSLSSILALMILITPVSIPILQML